MYSAATSGKLQIEICEAELTHNTEMIGKMDPYVKFKYDKIEHKTRVKDEAGKHPRWNQTFDIYVKDSKNERIKFEVMDKDMMTSSHVGECSLVINEMTGMSGNGMEKWHDIFHKNKKAGKLLLKTKWMDQ